MAKTPSRETQPTADGLAAAAGAAARRGPPPVHLWNPPFCGDIDIRIARDGTWFYLGTPIGRAPLVRLFASILKREEGEHFLVTPVEKVRIRVDDAPFVAVDADMIDGVLHFATNVGDSVAAGQENPLRVDLAADGEPAPYVHVRRDLWARIDRKTFYRLVEMGEVRGDTVGVESGGVFFPLGPAGEG